MFIDQAKILVQAGAGGNGCVAFRREKFVPRGGPSGGDGGRGGNVYLECSDRVNTLLHFRFRRVFKAGRGGHGEGGCRHGKDGQDTTVIVPPGTQVYREPEHVLIKDCSRVGERILVASGGRGGKGNARFATPTHQAPRGAEPGSQGAELELFLVLKLIADVGLVGLPNAGKSTLISRISSARPKIADYPFTTLTPHLGVVHLVDVSEAEVDPVAAYRVVQKELGLFNDSLLRRKQVVVATKMDAVDNRRPLGRLKAMCTRRRLPFLAISAVTGQGVRELVQALATMLRE
jgi:GTP-binding protein